MYRVITIMADFGFSPYGWGKNSVEERGVGSNIADSLLGFYREYDVPKQLEARFAEWANHFELNYDVADFDWPAFHSEGRALAVELKQVLGDGFTVIYEKPIEAPDRGINKRVIA